MLEKQGDLEKALSVAKELRRLLGPPLPERTRYCYEQNPARKAGLKDGSFDPIRDVDAVVDSLIRKISGK